MRKIVALASSAMLLLAVPAWADHGTTTRESVSTDGTEADKGSAWPAITADGRYVAFSTSATTLVAGDTNASEDIFVRDRTTGVVERVSVTSDGGQADGDSAEPDITPDGRYVVFSSVAKNLVGDDTNFLKGGLGRDIFVRDRVAGTTERVSVSSAGEEGEGFGNFTPSISADGRYVSWVGWMAGFVPEDTNQCSPFQLVGECPDVFVHDRETGETERVSVSSDGAQADRGAEPDTTAISADGRYVAFGSRSTNLVEGDTNDSTDVFVHDRETGQTERVSVGSLGAEALGNSYAPSISADGRMIAFTSEAINLATQDQKVCFFYFDSIVSPCPDVFVHDRDSGETILASVSSHESGGDDWSIEASISADGRHVAFTSKAQNLVPRDMNMVPDTFVRDLEAGTTSRVSVSSAGTEGLNGRSRFTSISAHGRYVAFVSGAPNLVVGDTNLEEDVFVRDRGPVACPSGARAEGPVSGPAYHAEQAGGPAGPAVGTANCEVVVPAGV